MLRDEKSIAGSILCEKGFELAKLRDEVSATAPTASDGEARTPARVVEDLEGISAVVDRLGNALSDQETAKRLIEEIGIGLERFRW